MLTLSGGTVMVHVKTEPGASDGTTPAKLCAASANKSSCYPAVADNDRFPANPQFRLVARSKKRGTAQWILFTAERQPFFSRQDHVLTLLALDSSLQLRNTLPSIVLSEQSETRVWYDPKLSPAPILSTADFVWNMQTETHFGQHHYRVRTYLWNEFSQSYRLSDEYVTVKQYPGFDEVEDVQVIEAELSTITTHLREKRKG